ncbi:hypothetical protein KDA_75590 [Dictyobacter alpinus]|uniref:Uncharacterized protein n=2 Tax=Dictyobacter alpinus TaxID=2014873 RepID=A0A402BL34_9CHLR|nr:hypothetical protein KDA_75590 [Dictyobacter alpinus]
MTNAVPFGVYIAPTSIIRADIRKHVSNDGEWCYIQLLKRNSYVSYTAYVAPSLADLRRISLNEADSSAAADRVFVSTVSRQDLHLECGLLSAPQAESPVYVAPDCILKNKCSGDGEELQLFASSAWLCYFRVLQVFADGSVSIRVAALPHRVHGQCGRSYFTTLSRDEFALALELERHDLTLATCDLREKVEQKAHAILGHPVEHSHPAVHSDDGEQDAPTPKPSYPPEVLKLLRPIDRPLCAVSQKLPLADEEQFPEAQKPKTKGLKPVFVPEAIAQEAVARFKTITGKDPTSRKLQQKVWLQAALMALRSYREQAAQKNTVEADIGLQDQQIRSVLVNWLSSAVQLVEIVPAPVKPRFKKDETPRLYGYVVRIQQPEMAA